MKDDGTHSKHWSLNGEMNCETTYSQSATVHGKVVSQTHSAL